MSLVCVQSLFGQVSFGQAQKINDNWRFVLEGADPGLPPENDRRWRSVDLPHDWSVRGQYSPSLASCTAFLPGGIGWYMKRLDIPEHEEGEKFYLYFEGIYNRSQVWLNGHSLGHRPNGYISFMYDITPYINKDGDDLLTVRVDHSRYADSRWYTGSGIYRDVYLVRANPVHIAQWGVYAYPESADAKKGVLSFSVEIENGTDKTARVSVLNELVDADGRIVAKNTRKLDVPSGTATVSGKFTVSNPRLWSLDDPNLYTLRTTVYSDGREIDKTNTITAFRTFTFDPDHGFSLNGVNMKVKGVCIHHDAGVLGSAVPEEVWRTRLATLKEIGCNAIRTTHNPQAPVFYRLCDEMGFLVLNEMYDEWHFPKRKWIEGWNVGTPGFDGSYDFFEEWGVRDIEDFVRRDRNHPSVFMWSIGNEVDYPNDPYSHPVLNGGAETGFTQKMFGGYDADAPDAMELGTIAKKLVDAVKKYDTSRPTTAGLAGVVMSNFTEYPFIVDIAGYNYTEALYDSDHKKYPQRIIYGSENRHDYPAWLATRDREHIFGQFLWTGLDYLGEAGRWPSRGLYVGLVDFKGDIKPKGYYRQSLWSDKPMVYIGTYPAPARDSRWGNHVSIDGWPVWNYREGEIIRVVCCTNGATARLELNGSQVGEMNSIDPRDGVMYWDIPFAEGTLEAVAMDADGRECARYSIRSSGRPSELRIVDADCTMSRNRGVAQISIQVVDENGVPVMLSDDMVTCTVEGPAKLLGLESGDNSDMSDYTDNLQRVFLGAIKAYVQATGEEGEVKVKFTAPWLKPAGISIDIE